MEISFKDINADNYTDVIIIAQFIPGYGSMENKYMSLYRCDIFFGSSTGFHTQKNLFERFDFIESSLMTLEDIEKSYKKINIK